MNRQNIQIITSGYPFKSLKPAASAPLDKQLLISSVYAHNSSPAPSRVGIFHSITSDHFKVFGLRSSDVDLSNDIKAGTAISLFTTTNNEGVLFQAKEKFGLVTFNISQAQTGSPVFQYQYWNGTAWTSLVLKETPKFTSLQIEAIAFDAPIDWAIGDGTEGGDDGLYSIRVLATTAPSQAVQIDEIKICKALAMICDVLPSGFIDLDLEDKKLLLQQGEEIIGLFSVPFENNIMGVAYQVNP